MEGRHTPSGWWPPAQSEDFLVRHVLHELGLEVAAKKVLAKAIVVGLREPGEAAVQGFHHQPFELATFVAAPAVASQPCPRSGLMTFQPEPRNSPSSPWMILRCAQAVQALQIAVHHEHQVVEPSRAARLMAPRDSGLVHLAVTHKKPRPLRFSVLAMPRACGASGNAPGRWPSAAPTPWTGGELPELGHPSLGCG